MRPVNLIPPEDRRGDRAPLRAGGLSYVVVGALAAVLVAVLALVMTQNSITDRESEIAELEVVRDAAAARAAALAPYAEFASIEEQREQTIASLAQSRFDWERVLRELALVIPANVKLDELQAATAGGSEAGGDETSTGTTANAGSAPSLSMSGCTPTHDDVAAFVAALEDIDGVTRVGLESSTKSKAAETDATQAPASGEAGGGCSVGETSFALLAVFDGAATATVPAEPTTPAAPATAPAETNSTEEQVAESQNAVDLVPGAAR
jgi:Tfp pilus assembly protein PilN